MTHQASDLPQTGARRPSPVRHRRISPKVRLAIELYVKEGKSWAEAAEAAGMSETGIHMAKRKPHVQALIEQTKQAFVEEVASLKAPFKAAALRHARHLMTQADSEAVQAKMVEFLGREEAKPAQINISNQVFSGGYEYVRPGQRVVTIEGEAHAPDDASSAQGDE